MKQIKPNILCYYCYGCNRLELQDFNGVMRCKNFTAGITDYREKLEKELRKK